MDITGEFLDGLRAQAKAEEPAEKAKAVADMNRTATELKARGSDYVDGRGQKIGSIPPRIYFRWQNMLPGCWQDKTFVEEFLWDNPQCRAVGYNPPSHSLRNSITYTGSVALYHLKKHEVI